MLKLQNIKSMKNGRWKMNKDKRTKLENDLVSIVKDSMEVVFVMGYDMGYKHKDKLDANREFQEYLREMTR